MAILDIVNNGTETMIFRPEEMLGIVDLRSLGYYKIEQGIIQENLSKITDLKEQKNSVSTLTILLTH